MADHGAYGQQLADAMQVQSATSFVTPTTLRAARIAVTEIKYDRADKRQTTPVGTEDSLLMITQIRDWPKRVLWEDGKSRNALPLNAGTVTIFDLRKIWTGERVGPVHYLCFYLPRAALNAIGEMEGIAPADEFPNDYCGGNQDATIWSLAQTLLPAFARPDEANRLFVDHVTSATCAHVLRQYGAGVPVRRSDPVRLPENHRKRVEEAMAEKLGGDLTVAALASECGMAVTDFSRAFERTTGLPPHQWLVRRRIDKAMQLLKDSRLSIAEVGAAAGFTSVAHFNRVFRQSMLLSPRAWRNTAHH